MCLNFTGFERTRMGKVVRLSSGLRDEIIARIKFVIAGIIGHVTSISFYFYYASTYQVTEINRFMNNQN